MKRVFVVVFDGFGIGQAPDAKDFGDEGSNTLKSVSESKFFNISTLKKIGLLNIDGVQINKEKHIGSICRLQEISKGKDSTTGHWEMAGIITQKPMPTFKNGFPKEVIEKLEDVWQVKILCNKPYSGTKVILDYGQEHIRTKNPIVYTSADSVLQIACHEDIVPVKKLYQMCEQAREIMSGDYAVGRIIARPFVGKFPNFTRTENRKDFSLVPPKENLLKVLRDNQLDVLSIGKIDDMFAGKNISKIFPGRGNAEELKQLLIAQKIDFKGLCFVNLCDFDMLYGHRNDVDGYAKALKEADVMIAEFISKMRDEDVLIVTADHGCDPKTISTDHSREYVPFLMYYNNIVPKNYNTKLGFNHVGATVLDLLNVKTSIGTLSKKFSLK